MKANGRGWARVTAVAGLVPEFNRRGLMREWDDSAVDEN
jgi:hypothetical protein